VALCWIKALDASSNTHGNIELGKIVDLREGERREFDLELSGQMFAKVTGSVVIGDRPFCGQVMFYKDGKWVDSAMSNEAGKFTAFVSPGSYRVQVKGLFADAPIACAAGEEVERDFHVTAVTVRLRVVGPDGAPRSGVRLITADFTGRAAVHFPASGKDGYTERQLSPGTYDFEVMPKRLADQQALREFYEANKTDPGAMARVLVRLVKINARVDEGKRIEVKLPVAAGY
jgi:hypothetical protein